MASARSGESGGRHEAPQSVSGRLSGRVRRSAATALVSGWMGRDKHRDRVVARRSAMTFALRLSAAGLEHLRQQLTARDWAVLEDVARCRLLTGRHVQLLHFGTDETAARAARRLLARLAGQRLLARLSRRIGGVRAGSNGYVYGLGVVGHRLLHPDRPGRRLHEVRDGFLTHTLAISDLYVSLRQAEQRGRLELLRVELEPQCWRRLEDRQRAGLAEARHVCRARRR